MHPLSISTFEVDDWKRLERFLILGSENGTYCISEPPLTIENAGAARACLRVDGLRVVRTLVDVSISKRAPKNNPALFVLAMAACPKYADAPTNAAALKALPQAARTGAHLASFAGFAQNLRGWGRGLRTAVADWYVEKPVRELATQMLQDARPAGWSHRDLLRLAHPKSASPVQNSLFRWAVDGELGSLEDDELAQVHAVAKAQKATSEAEIVGLIEDHRLTSEMIPSRWRNSARVWEALLEGMPYAAMLRNIGLLTALGLIAPQSEACSLVVARLADRIRIRSAKVHPVAVLDALLAYKQGRRDRSKVHWAPVSDVINALDAAFYLAFENIQPSGARVYLAIDANESCRGAACHGMRLVTAAMGAAVLAMAFARTERRLVLDAFHERTWRIDISAHHRLDGVCRAVAHEPKHTDASLPFKSALSRGLQIDAFIVVTDSKTWIGEQHPGRALADYRQATGIPAKLAVLALAANRYSLVDPGDAGQLEIAGFDASVPEVLRDFLAN